MSELDFVLAQNEVLVDQVIALEDVMLNHAMEEFAGVITDTTREFWREQLLTNRDSATVVLRQMAAGVAVPVVVAPVVAPVVPVVPDNAARRAVLHNRQALHVVQPTAAAVAPAGGGGGDGRAVKIRNRAHELAKNECIPFSIAFRRIEREMAGQ